jgi:hypothetical protein
MGTFCSMTQVQCQGEHEGAVRDCWFLVAMHQQSLQHRVVGSCWLLGVVCAPAAAAPSIGNAKNINMKVLFNVKAKAP